MSRLAQSVEHQTLNLRVVGSSPTLGDICFPKEYHQNMLKNVHFMRCEHFSRFHF